MSGDRRSATCQSCGASLYHETDFGTLADGSPSGAYCRDCFQGGRFVEAHLTLEDMIERHSRARSLAGAEEGALRQAVRGFLGNLARWHGDVWTPPPSTVAAVPDPGREEPSA